MITITDNLLLIICLTLIAIRLINSRNPFIGLAVDIHEEYRNRPVREYVSLFLFFIKIISFTRKIK